MREYFYNLLERLDKLTGHRQLEKLMTAEKPEDEINELLDVLCRTSDLFPLIPKNDQKAIISHAVVADGEFIGLNAKIVYKWLNAQKDRYFKEAAHIPSEVDPNWKPVGDEERAKWLREWHTKVTDFENKATTQSHVQELVAKLPPKEKGISYPSTSAEKVLATELHLQYLREMNATGLPREQWISEQQWIDNLNK